MFVLYVLNVFYRKYFLFLIPSDNSTSKTLRPGVGLCVLSTIDQFFGRLKAAAAVDKLAKVLRGTYHSAELEKEEEKNYDFRSQSSS